MDKLSAFSIIGLTFNFKFLLQVKMKKKMMTLIMVQWSENDATSVVLAWRSLLGTSMLITIF